MKKIIQLIDVIKLSAALIIGTPLKKRKGEIWLIGERKGEARDNGYHLFKYIREKYPAEHCYYVIEKNSKDLEKIKKYKNILYHGTFNHFLHLVMADKLICAHQGSCVPDTPIAWKYLDKFKKIKIFIQHGITKEKIETLMYHNNKADLFICGAAPEYEYIKSQFGYPPKNVSYIGFSRFDNLHNYNEKKQILIMPTWRSWFGMTDSDGNSEKIRSIFKESQYYKVYNDLLNDKDFIELIEEEKIEVIFYPHQEMQRFLDLFSKNSSNIIIADSKEYDVQQLLKESRLLITDYSSIAFDFAYMRKPLVYFQFDQNEYYQKHYSKGYFDYERDGFGKVSLNKENLIKEVKEIIKNKKTEKKFYDRAVNFFPLYDTDNCKRHYEVIKGVR